MRRHEVLDALTALLPNLRAELGVRRLALFGSTARDEARPDSDVDVLVEFEGAPTFRAFMGLKFRLEDELGRRVDLATPSALKPRIRPNVEREAVLVC